MTLSLDHVFVITQPGAPVGDRLAELGMVEGDANTHPGQGTANRRFFFDGFTLELLFISDAKEAATGAGRGLGVLERSQHSEASPFGLVTRMTDKAADKISVPEFDSWQYYPDYFNGELCFFVGSNSTELHEPLCICMPPALPQRSSIPAHYANPSWHFSSLSIVMPESAQFSMHSTVLKHFASMERVEIVTGEDHHLELQFNDGADSQTADLRPGLPMTVRW